MANPLTGLPNPSPIYHLWDIRDWQVHNLNPFTAATLPKSERQEGYRGEVQMYTSFF